MILVLLFFGLFVVWFTYYVVNDYIEDQKIKKLVEARERADAHDRMAENPRRNRR